MTPKELKELIAQSPVDAHKEWVKTKKETLNFRAIDFSTELTGVSAIYTYLYKQKQGWEKKITEANQAKFSNYLTYFNNVLKSIELWVTTFFKNPNQNHNQNVLESEWQKRVKGWLNNSSNGILTFDCPEVDFLIKLAENKPKSYDGAFAFLISNSVSGINNNPDYFIGAILAYEFKMANDSQVSQRITSEVLALNDLRNGYAEYLSTSENELVSHLAKANEEYNAYAAKIDETKTQKENEFNAWFEESKATLDEFNSTSSKEIETLENTYNEKIRLAEQKLKEQSEAVDELKAEKENKFKTFFDSSKTSLNEFIEAHKNLTVETEQTYSQKVKDSSKIIEELEDLYSKKLQLAEPAEFWLKQGKKMQCQGWWALVALVGLVAATTYSLWYILVETPTEIYISFFAEDKSAAIRWSIIYITFISFIAFCVRAISKVMFSSFHLARDCQERHTLTYFYLSLLKDTEVTKEDRQLIMQSLFSRAETGLLKDDSTPSMPNDVVNKFFSKD